MDLSNPCRLTVADFDQELLILFDAYVHGNLDRRGFLDQAARFAVGGVTAAGLLAALSPDFAIAQVVHENRGLNPHIEDIARRLAVDGYLAMAPDALTPLGGYPGDEDKARALFAQLDQGKTRQDFLAAAAALKARPEGNGRMGVVGFCYGGGVAYTLATHLPDLAAAVPFYGNVPAAEEAAKVKAPLLIHFAEKDDRINAAWPTYEAALKAAGVRYTAHQYPGTQHGFNNDTTPRFDASGPSWPGSARWRSSGSTSRPEPSPCRHRVPGSLHCLRNRQSVVCPCATSTWLPRTRVLEPYPQACSRFSGTS